MSRYPLVRMRRTRAYPWIREISAQTKISASDLVLPLFVVEGMNQQQEIKTMPEVFRYSIDRLLDVVKYARELGICAVMLFPSVDNVHKSTQAQEAWNEDNLICRSVKAIKELKLDVGVICDVALDPYTTHGHDGLLDDSNNVNNDATLDALIKQSLCLARAGVDMIAPSDMMDGRIGEIRKALESQGYGHIMVLAYSAKYNSSLYSPFRDALKSNKERYLCKATYQMDIRNGREALRETLFDIEEGADIVMIKPASFYLDIISRVREAFDINIWGFQVSGEYSMMKLAAQHGVFDWNSILLESIVAIKRAGADIIVTYGALDIAKQSHLC